MHPIITSKMAFHLKTAQKGFALITLCLFDVILLQWIWTEGNVLANVSFSIPPLLITAIIAHCMSGIELFDIIDTILTTVCNCLTPMIMMAGFCIMIPNALQTIVPISNTNHQNTFLTAPEKMLDTMKFIPLVFLMMMIIGYVIYAILSCSWSIIQRFRIETVEHAQENPR